MKRKVTIVGGAGNVGATVARSIAGTGLADVVIIDIAESKAAGIALDIYETCPIIGSDTRLVGGTDWAPAADLLSARLGFRKKISQNKTIDLFISGDNLTDAQYCLGFDLNATGGRYFNTAPGRNFNVGVQLTVD